MSPVQESLANGIVVPVTPIRLSSNHTARYLGVSSQTLANWRNLGRGPRFSRDGLPHSRVFYRVADLDAWVNSGHDDAEWEM